MLLGRSGLKVEVGAKVDGVVSSCFFCSLCRLSGSIHYLLLLLGMCRKYTRSTK